jgi:hypothetical protein
MKSGAEHLHEGPDSMILFHGCRPDSPFTAFDETYVGKGEGAGVGVGFYFVTSLKGAAAHADSYTRGKGEALVYVCQLRESAIVLNRFKAIGEQHARSIEWWNRLPCTISCACDENWFGSLFKHRPRACPVWDDSEAKKCEFLRERGLHAIYDFEGSFTDSYLHGTSVLVLAQEMIEIVEVINVKDIHSETVGEAKRYVLADTERRLSETDVQSRLRRVGPKIHS